MTVAISQIYISDNNARELPEGIQQATHSVISQIPNSSHHLYTDEELRVFISERFGREVLVAYDLLVPYAYKADLARYCLLYELGGWYFDLGIRGNNIVLDSTPIDALFFRDVNRLHTLSWGIANAIIYSIPKNKIFEKCIQMIIENCANHFYGETPLCPTGPSLLGRAVAYFGANKLTLFGNFSDLTPEFRNKNMAFILPEGTIFAWRRSGPPGDLSPENVQHTNNYAHLYETKKIYSA